MAFDVLLCSVGSVACALPLGSIMEVMRPLRIEPVARAPRAVLGMSMIRGAPTVVVDVADLLGYGVHPPARFVTVRTGDRVVALAVQAVQGVERIADTRELPPLLRDEAAVEQIAARDADLLFVLRASRLVPPLEEVAP